MTREELASKLDHLDPGATLTVEAILAALFGDGRLSKEALAMIEAFALDHRCTFSVEHGRGTPTFEKDDMLAIAEYFSHKPWPDLGQPRSPKDIAERALTAEHSVGCTGCHLDRFQGDGTVPRLAGQGRDYLAQTMIDFRTRARGNNPGMSDLMIAAPEDDLAALAQYLAGL